MFTWRMKLRTSPIIVVLLLLASLTINMSAQEQNLTLDTVFAEYSGGKITKADYDAEFDKIPMMYRSRFSTLEGQENFLNSLIINNIFYLKAVALGVDKQPETIASIEDGIKRFYTREFIRRDITAKAVLTEQEIKSFYEEYPVRFTENANTVIQYIEVDDEETAKTVRSGLDRGTDFIDLLNQYSVNQFAKRNQGIIRNIRGNGYIQGVGRNEGLDNAIKEAVMNRWIGPLHTEDGYHFFKVTERVPSRLKPLEDVRFEIEGRLRPQKESELRNQVFEQLKDTYEIKVIESVVNTLNLSDLRPGSDLYEKPLITAKVPELVITGKDFHNHISTLSSQERAQLSNPEHIIRNLNYLLESSLFAYEAIRKGYEKYVMEDPDVQQIYRNTILRALYQKLVMDYVAATPEEIEAFYNQNIRSYTSNERRTIQLFLFDTNRAAKAARKNVVRALRNEDDEKIETIIANSLHKTNNGVVSNVQREGSIPTIGDDEIIRRISWNTKVADISRINKDSQGRFFFLRTVEEHPEYVVPLEQVEADIQHRLTAARRDQRWNELQEELKKEFNVVVYPEKLAASLTAKELFDLAEDALKRKRHNEAIQYYDRIIKIFENNDDDYKALFMKAFLYAEELKKNDEAIALFEELITKYPHNDLHESAEFMIKALRDGYDIFED